MRRLLCPAACAGGRIQVFIAVGRYGYVQNTGLSGHRRPAPFLARDSGRITLSGKPGRGRVLWHDLSQRDTSPEGGHAGQSRRRRTVIVVNELVVPVCFPGLAAVRRECLFPLGYDLCAAGVLRLLPRR